MPEESDQSEKVSKEAFDRVTRERDSLKEQAETAKTALGSYLKRDRAREALKGKVDADRIDSIADLVTPHLSDVDLDDIPDTLGQDKFKALYVTTPSVNGGESEGEEGGNTEPPGASEPAQQGFGGPSPANAGSGGPQVGTAERIAVGSSEYKALVSSGDEEALKAAYEKGLIVEPTRPW